MIKEIIKGAIAILITGGAVASVFFSKEASQVLIPIASFVIGYYFKDKQDVVVGKIKGIFEK